MNINCLLEMASGVNSSLDLKSNLVSSKTTDNDFNGMFDNVINSQQETNTVKYVDKEINASENKHINNEVKTEKNNNSKKIDNVTCDENKFEKVKKDEDKKIDDATCESFLAILNLIQTDKIDLSKYFNVNEDGTYEVKLENINELKLDIQNYFDVNNINIDLKSFDAESFDFEKVCEVALNFVCNEANKQVNFNNVFVKDNEKIINIEDVIVADKDAEVSDEEIMIFDDADNNKENINFNNTINIEENHSDFEVFKNTVNEMIDSIEVTDDKIVAEKVSDEGQIIIPKEEFKKQKVEIKETKVSDEETTDEEIIINEETSEEKIIKPEDKKEFEHKEDKKENKDVKRIKIENAKSEYSLGTNKDEFEIVPKDLKDVLAENNVSESLTDRYMETISVAKQMVKGMELKLSENSQEMNIKLDPENLGKVNLKIVTENGLVTAKFEAENQKVKEIIESNLSLLKESLEKRGVEVSALDVSVNQNLTQNNNQNNIDYMRKIAQGKNPHKILGKGINNLISLSEIDNSELKKRGLFMTKSKVNYIA